MKQSNYHQNREYFTLVEKTGSWNRYQFYLFVIFFFMNIFDSALMFAPPFLFYFATYECEGRSSDACTSFVCSLDFSERDHYLPDSPFRSLAQDFDVDFQCEYASTIPLFSTLVFIGSMGGMLVYSTFTERIGRKASLSSSVFLFIVGLILTLLSGYYKSITLVIPAIILTYCGCENGSQYAYCYSTEVVAEQWRIPYINMLNAVYGLGVIIVAAAFYIIKQWTYVYLFVFLVPAILTFLAINLIIEKTPLNMLATDTDDIIMQRLQRLCKMNGVQFTVTIEEVRYLKQDYTNSVNRAAHQSFTVVDIFGYKSLRKIIVPLILLNFSISYLFYSPSVIKSSVSNNLFEENIIQGLSSMISSIVVHFYFEYIERKKANFILIATAFIFLWLILVEEENKSSIFYTVCYLVYRVCISLLFFMIFLMNYESFPTQIRAVGAPLSYLIGSVSGILQPSITQAWKNRGWNVLYSFMGVCVLGLIPNFFLKETSNAPPPQIIEELENNQKNEGQQAKKI